VLAISAAGVTAAVQQAAHSAVTPAPRSQPWTNPAMAALVGEVIGTEANNLARDPLLGRNFEYFGEAPFLSGTMAALWRR